MAAGGSPAEHGIAAELKSAKPASKVNAMIPLVVMIYSWMAIMREPVRLKLFVRQ
jgi:drug/metabolite transporter (DMT)-like permease